jgi:hypothetical protein
MKRIGTWFLVTLVVGALAVAGCGGSNSPTEAEPAITIEEQDNGLSKLILSEHAAQRLGVATAPVEDQGAQKTVPYAAVIYDAQGATWAYAVSDTLTYQRAPITIDEIAGDQAILSDGPDAGTEVVIIGAAELYGAETGVGGGH